MVELPIVSDSNDSLRLEVLQLALAQTQERAVNGVIVRPQLTRGLIEAGRCIRERDRQARTDGIVNWRTSLLRPSSTAENIEVHLASHIGLGVNPAALWAVADRLAQAEGEFRQFDRSGPFAIAYGTPENAQS